MRQPPRARAWLMVACATSVAGFSARAQQVVQPPPQPYTQTMQFGAGYINTPAAWVSRRSADSWLTISAKDIPSFDDPAGNKLASRLNSNFAIDTHWGGRASVGLSFYSQNPEWGFFGQALLIRDGDFGQRFMPAFSIGARNIGKFKHEDRFLIGHDVRYDSAGQSDEIVVSRYDNFKTSPTLYAVATKEVPLSGYSRNGQMSMSFSLGYEAGTCLGLEPFLRQCLLSPRWNNQWMVLESIRGRHGTCRAYLAAPTRLRSSRRSATVDE